MIDITSLICACIAKQEGRFTSNNPGDLVDAPWFPELTPYHAVGDQLIFRYYPDGTRLLYANDFWVPASRVIGIAGMRHVVSLHIAEGNTLAQLITIWAPPSKNNTTQYILNCTAWIRAVRPDLNFNPDTPLWSYVTLDNLDSLLPPAPSQTSQPKETTE